MPGWWESFLAKWSWDDPTLLLGFASFVVAVASFLVTTIISIVLWKMGAKQAKRDSEQAKRDSELQAKILENQTLISQRQRRDALPEIIERASYPTHLEMLWKEVSGYKKEDQDFLLTLLRSNPALPLPGTSTKVQDKLTDEVVSLYVNGFERRYAESDGWSPYPGLFEFITEAKGKGAKIEDSRIVALVTGLTAEKQPQNHRFYEELVRALPQTTVPLLEAVERIDSCAPNGLKLNVLTGALLAVKDLELECRDGSLSEEEVRTRKYGIAKALASLLSQGALRSFDGWELEGTQDRVTAAAAWLIRAVGWVADVDELQSTWMIENLASAIQSIPESEGRWGWGIDNVDVHQGFEWISKKCPELWKTYGEELEAAATKIGPWKEDLSS
ncbi:hypothetical protein [Rothia mucilaginosa]|jgi:hypothetical protein|uniref:hypothetical protein n=1 Tax=Rothia mucilaginosa TaxID=43675 RepID=UPI0026F08060|nr:hypothetical protein [Rothia mucilaginosa]